MMRAALKSFPLLLILLFSFIVYGLIVSSLESHERLRLQETARAEAQNIQRASLLNHYVAELGERLEELAQSPEIANYLTNRSLGMSMRYGLQASRDEVAALLVNALSKRYVGFDRIYSRVVFLDEAGETVADTSEKAQPFDRALIRNGKTFRIDEDSATLIQSLTIRFKDGSGGHLVSWSDLDRMAASLFPSSGEDTQVILTTFNGIQIFPHVHDRSSLSFGIEDKIAALPEGKLGFVKSKEKGIRLAVVRHAVPDTSLVLATAENEDLVFGKHYEGPFIAVAALFPPLLLIAAIFNERLRRRNARTEQALRSSRIRLMELTDNLDEGVVLVDVKGRILFVNLPALRIMGVILSPQTMMGRSLDELFRLDNPGTPLGFEQAPWPGVISNGVDAQDSDATFVSSKENKVAVGYRGISFEDHEHGPSAIISFRDIETLKKAQREAMQSFRMAGIGQLAAGIAHEINTPVQYIGDNLHFIEDAVGKVLPVLAMAKQLAQTATDKQAALEFEDGYGKADIGFLAEELPNAIHQSLDGVGQVARIVLSMKEFSHPGGTGKNLANLNRALENTLTVSRNTWKHVAKIETRLEAGLPLVNCHIGEMNQVFLNLIVNATQAIENSGKPFPGTIAVSTRSEKDAVLIEVADSGPGVPMEIRDKIFDPFFTTKSVGRGTGQGLAICYDIVTVKHGGSIEVGGVPGEGAVFTIRLPVETVVEPD
ncbi:MAG: hypothetical protein EPN26_07760 [Rhodospirillales bacterium]|nr:MAG: hypothetical protein EPN26_07760 [Rhodospirillales bacterium]